MGTGSILVGLLNEDKWAKTGGDGGGDLMDVDKGVFLFIIHYDNAFYFSVREIGLIYNLLCMFT